MAIKSRSLGNPEADRWQMKSNQQYELAALARQDGDHVAEQKYLEQARTFGQRALEVAG